MSNKPTLLMSFAANDLPGIKKETSKIWKSAKNNVAIKAKKVTNATIETLAEKIIDIGKDLFMFHFGGHADQKGIVLAGFEEVDKIRLSRLLLPNKNHQVQLIFLNGCLSYGHVGILTAKGVKAIIATNVKVDDEESVRIAAFFYKLFLENNATLKEAFETAEATVSGNNSYITIVNPGEIDENQPMPSAWTLFIHAHHKEVMDWTLADFLKEKATKSTPPPSISQVHQGNGDNIGGNRIDRQINMGAGSTYIEQPTNNAATPSPKQSTENPPNKNDLQNLVARGNIKEALAKIATMSNDSHVTLLQSRLARLQREENLGVMDRSDASIERNRITHGVLSLLDDLFS